MKLLLFGTVAAFILWEVMAESCRASDASTCIATTCATGATPVCINEICTCTVLCREDEDLGRCRSSQDCLNRYNDNRLACTCQDLMDLHCVDGECHCVHLNFP